MDILLVEDDNSIAQGLKFSLEQEGFGVAVCKCCAEAYGAMEGKLDLALIDLTLPDGSGYDVCRRLREQKGGVPVIFLTACDDELSVVMGLEMGADDYVTKPFRVRELISRIKTVARRCGGYAQNILEFGGVRVDTAKAKAFKGDKALFLTALEYRLLVTLMSNEGRVLSRGQLLSAIWDEGGEFVNDNTLTVYIKRLREKLSDKEGLFIKTVRGLGYMVGRD